MKYNQFPPNAMILYGGGGHGKSIIELIQVLGAYQLVGIIDDGLKTGDKVLGVPVFGGSDLLEELRSSGVLFAANAVGGIGDVDQRIRVFDTLERHGFTFPALIHPEAYIEPSSRIEDGAQVLAKSYVSSESSVGFGSVLNAGVIVSHDCQLGRIVNLSPGAALAGGVKIGDYSQVGMNATINLNITIGERVRIGNGATIKQDVPSGTIVHAGTIWPVFHEPRVKNL